MSSRPGRNSFASHVLHLPRNGCSITGMLSALFSRPVLASPSVRNSPVLRQPRQSPGCSCSLQSPQSPVSGTAHIHTTPESPVKGRASSLVSICSAPLALPFSQPSLNRSYNPWPRQWAESLSVICIVQESSDWGCGMCVLRKLTGQKGPLS